MRVIFLLPDLPLSGTPTRLVRWSVLLADRGHDVVIGTLTPNVHPDLAAELRIAGVAVLHLTRPRHLLLIWRLLADRRSTVLHAALPTAGLVGLLLARARRVPLVYSVTNCLHRHRPYRVRTARDLTKSGMESLAVRRADAVHVVAASLEPQLAATFPGTRGRIATLVDLQFDAAVQTPLPTSAADRAPMLLTVARLVPHKGVDAVLQAVRQLLRRRPGLRLVVLGSGPERARLLRRVTELGLDGVVDFPGAERDVARWLAAADVLVHASVYEGYPRVIVEAHARGVPVVMIDTPAGREATQHGCVVLARPADTGSLADAIDKALDTTRVSSTGVSAELLAEQVEELHARALTVRTVGVRRRPCRTSDAGGR